MAALTSYSTGTISIGAGATSVVGVGSIWTGGNVFPGDKLVVAGHEVTIIDVVDATHLTIEDWPYSAVTAGSSYKIYKTSSLRVTNAQIATQTASIFAALASDGYFYFIDTTETVPDPSLGDDGQYALKPSTGEVWLKTGGVWVLQGIYKAFSIKGAWSGATAYDLGDVVSSSGSSYVCVLAHTNHVPPNATYWVLLASKGDTGAPGADGADGADGAPGADGADGAPGADGADGAGYGGTSTTSLLIAIASKVFTTQAGLAYQIGNYVRASSAANGANYMEGYVLSYSSTTLTIDVTKIGGSGTLADWNFSISGAPGSGSALDVACLRGFISGLTLSTAGSSATFGISIGVAVDSAQTDFTKLTSAYSKTTSAWAVGSTNGALDTGAIANSTWYHVYLIKRPDTGVVDVLISTSASSPTMPTNYTLKRRIGSMKTNGSAQWTKFYQNGNEFLWDAPVADASALAVTTSPSSITLSVPPGVTVNAIFQGDYTNTASAQQVVLFYSPVTASQAPGSPAGHWSIINQIANSFVANFFNNIRTNTSAQINAKSGAAANNSLYVITHGWIDSRGRED